MGRALPAEIDVMGFEANLLECSDYLQEIVAYLRSTAKYADVDVTPRRFKHPKPNNGWGIGYYIDGDKFCEVHPKIQKNHAGVFLHGADRAAIVADGFEPSEQDGWFFVRTMLEAVRFVKWISAARAGRR